MSRPAGPRVQRRWIVLVVIVLILFISISSIVRFYTDLLWFGELGLTGVFWKILWTRVGIGVVGGLLAGVIVLANLEVARRSAPRYRFATAASDITEQYRSAFRPYARLANIILAAVVALFTGLSTSAVWDRYLLWRNARPFGIKAPAPFGHDVAYYVFTIPFQRAILSWLFGIVVASLLLAAVAHLLNGSIQPEPNRVRVATSVKVHVSALLGALALLKAWAYRLDVYELVFSERGVVTGASYTDVKAQRMSLFLLMAIAVIVAVIFIVNVLRFRGWLLPGAALALWAFTSIALGAIYPAFVQRFQVVPNESERERPYIAQNIKQTRLGFGLDRIDEKRFPARQTLSDEDIADNQGTIDNVRVWDPAQLRPIYQRTESIRAYYDFDDVDIDRYDIDGKLTQIMLAGREVDATKLPGAGSWVNQTLTYTHGYGIAASPANAVNEEGRPELIVRDLPPEGAPELLARQPGIYYGERPLEGSYVLARTKQKEVDYATEERSVTTSYSGKGGIRLSNMLRRLAFAVRFGDTDLVLSSFVSPDSRLIMRRNIKERARTAAPFLIYDNDPYLVVANGRYYWILDAYTSTDRYPYSERINAAASIGANLPGSTNYMRNSVKVVTDAYDGSMNFYLVDETDALASTYQAAFPSLFTSLGRMPPEIKKHMRYPEDLFKVQALQYRAYHITDPEGLYKREDLWDIPKDPRSAESAPTSIDPYFVVMKLPGEDKEEFLLMVPFTPRDKPNLNGWMAARMDGANYGELHSFSFPRGGTIPGPENVYARIEQNGTISNQFTLWQGAGSSVTRGNLLVIPIGESLMFVEPIYLEAARSGSALPELRRVVVVIGDNIGFEPTFQEALDAALKGQGPSLEEGGERPPPEETPSEQPSGTQQELIQEALDHFERADAALRDGDLATYQREVQAGRRAVERAQNAE
jgi:uncharacterized membrane protein (UPF0182 family)